MVRRRILYFVILMASVFFQIVSEIYLATFLLVLVVSGPVLSLFLSLPAIRGCSILFFANHPSCKRGEQSLWIVEVRNRYRLPLSRVVLQWSQKNCVSGEVTKGKIVLSGASHGSRVAKEIETVHCSKLECQLHKIRVCDCLGLFTFRRPMPVTAVCYIFPVAIENDAALEPAGEQRGHVSLQPRPGGGPGEDYEVRPYRPGDPVRAIHWKLSSKRDDLVIRETLEEKRTIPCLTFDHFGTPEALDSVLDQLDGICAELLRMDRPHTVAWLNPVTGDLRKFYISTRREYNLCIAAALSDPATADGTSILDMKERVLHPGANHIHLSAKQEDGV